MRTKTLLLTAALTALSSAALMAQTNVYSLNAVGYINVTCSPGFNMIADQLISTNNSIGSLLNDASGAYDGVIVYSWNGTGFTHDAGDSQLSGTATGWDNNGVITMNPGQAVWFKNPNKTNMVLTFVGTVPQGTLTTTLAGSGAFTMASSQVPQGGDLVTNLGLTNFNNGDHVFVFNNTNGTGGYITYTADNLGGEGTGGLWDAPGDPQVAVGQGFWYQTFKTGATVTWTRTFSVSP
jgi:hypothetical protein